MKKGILDNKEVYDKPAVLVAPGAIVFNRAALLAQIKGYIEMPDGAAAVAILPKNDLKKIGYLNKP